MTKETKKEKRSKYAQLIANIKPVSKDREKLYIFVYGPPGVGKTWLVGSASKGRSVLLLKAEDGDLSISDTDTMVLPLFVPPDQKSNIKSRMHGVLSYLHSDECDYDVIALDGLTSLQLILAREFRSSGSQLTIQQYGIIIDWTNDVIASLCELNKTVIVLCHSKEEEDGEGSKKSRRPLLIGKSLPGSITAAFDVAAFANVQAHPTKKGEVCYRMLLKSPGSTHTVKDRTGKLGTTISNDFSEWMERLNAEPEHEESGKTLIE